MINIKKNISKLETLFSEVQHKYNNVDKEVQDINVDEDGVIESSNLEFEVSELESALDNLEDGLNETIRILKNLLDEFENWSV